jgi:hypothetical protein
MFMTSYEVIIRNGFKHAKDCDSNCINEIDGWLGGTFKKFGMRSFECPKCHELTKRPILQNLNSSQSFAYSNR